MSTVDKKPIATGKLWFRLGLPTQQPDNRKLFMVTGVIAVPENIDLSSEHIYPIIGMSSHEGLGMQITVSLQEGTKLESDGQTPSGLLCEPIWRV